VHVLKQYLHKKQRLKWFKGRKPREFIEFLPREKTRIMEDQEKKGSNELKRWTFKLPKGQICMEKNCNELAAFDYNGMGYFVCPRHDEKLNNEFDEEYR